jgi:murein DD-endopeptidase MepM/ murein hydrolase activator NlpD
LADATGWIALAFGLLFGAFVAAQLLAHGSDDAQTLAAEGASGPQEPATMAYVTEARDLPVYETAIAPDETGSAVPTPVEQHILEGKLRRNQTLSAALRGQDISAGMVHAIAVGMGPVFDFRYSRPGDHYWLARDANGELIEFRYSRSSIERYALRRIGDGEDAKFIATAYEPEIELRPTRLAGIVSSSLYEAMRQLGEEGELAHDFAEIFAWDVDFSRGVQPGDEFRVLYERRMLVEDDREEYLGPGRILAARYINADDEHNAVYYENGDDVGGYYRLDGSSVERQFLRAPLNYRRISSRFTSSRLHPILKVRRPHPAIDYAAPTGTPVWSVANGTVIFRGVLGGLGKTVKVRHSGGYVSFYAHLSRFPKGLNVGERVRQKQVVGYVGSTGTATGPHLDFRMQQHGKYLNPASVQAPPGDPISPQSMPEFLAMRDSYLDELDPQSLRVVTQEAGL